MRIVTVTSERVLCYTHWSVLSNLLDHCLQIFWQFVDWIVAVCKEMRTPAGQQSQCSPTKVTVINSPAKKREATIKTYKKVK
jgi:hypothetical protein